MSRRTREEQRYRRLRVVWWVVIAVWAVLCICIIARADRYFGDADAEFSAALAVREEQRKAWFASAHKISNCRITYYCCEERPHICNAGPPYITASGTKPTPGVTCAADDIPLGATVAVDWNGDGWIDAQLVCEDRFGGKQHDHIDICVATHKEALALGRRTATVYWCKNEGGD